MGVRTSAGLLLLLLPAAPTLHAEVEISVAGDRVSLRAVSAPLSEILDQLARKTGMKLVYDAAPPRQSVTATLEQRTAAETVLGVLEGLGLNYALVTDRGGSRVEQLLILGASAASPLRAAAPIPAPLRRQTPLLPVEPVIEEEPAEDPEFTEDPELLAPEDEEPAAPQPTGPLPTLPQPEYPSSSFTPKLPPAPTLPPQPAEGQPPSPEPTPHPQDTLR